MTKQTSKKHHLKCCPFCGGKACVEQSLTNPDLLEVICEHDILCPIDSAEIYSPDPKAIADKWNRRFS